MNLAFILQLRLLLPYVCTHGIMWPDIKRPEAEQAVS
jgi:hypothetical protein